LTFAVLILGVSTYSLLQSLVNPVLPSLERDLHTTQATVTWVLTAYLLSASVFTPILGRIGDMVGKERMFIVTLGALGAGSLLAALSSSVGVLILARVIQGIGGAVLPLAFGIIRDELPAHKVGGAIGVTAALTAVGGGLGIVVGGPVVESLGWHWLFWFPLIMCAVAGVAAVMWLPASGVRTPGHVNIPAAVLLSAWLVALLVGVSEGPAWGWGSGRTLGLLVLSVVLFVAWMAREWRSSQPLIDMKMMRQPAVWTNNLVALLVGVGLYANMAFLPAFVQTSPSRGYGFASSVDFSGLFLVPLAVAMFVTGLVSGRASNRIGAKAVLIIGTVLSVVPFVLLAAAAHAEWVVFVAMGFLGTGFGLAFSAMSALIVAAVPPEQTGVASGMNANIRTIGGSIGAAVMASIVTSSDVHGVPTAAGYSHGFAVLGVAAALAALAALLVPRTAKADQRPVMVSAVPVGAQLAPGPHE